MRFCGSSASVDDGPDEKQRAADEHECDEHDRDSDEAPLAAVGILRGANGEEEKCRARAHDQRADDERRDQGPEKVVIHRVTLPITPLPGNFPRVVRAAIFDFDETMIDLEEQHAHADAALCREMGDDYLDLPEATRLSSGRRIIDNIREMRATFGWQRDEASLFAIRQRFFAQACASTMLELMPAVEGVVRRLHDGGMRLAITSSAVRSGIDAILRRFDLRDCFELIVDGSEVEHGKPHPEAYEVTARLLNVEPSQCIVFEDSTVGVAAAKAAGMFCIAVRNPTAAIAQDLDAADLVISSFEELDVEGILGS